MTKRKRKILKITGIVFIVLFIIDIIAGNLLVTFAIKRPKEVNEDIMPDPITSKGSQDKVSTNREIIGKRKSEWLKKADRREVSIESDDGLLLKGEFIIADENSPRWVIAIHGYGYTGNHKAMFNYVLPFAERGYNILTPDMRAHGESEGKYIGMGWLDRKDILKWIDLITEKYPFSEIVLYGVSMGGAAVMMTSGEELPGNVKVIIEDCGYSSVWDIFSDEAKFYFHIPDFPLIYTASFFSKLRAGYGFKEASSLEQIKKTKLPVFFIHGSKDNFVHTDMVELLYNACPTKKGMFVADDAGHGEAYYLEPDEYVKEVFEFIDGVMGEE